MDPPMMITVMPSPRRTRRRVSDPFRLFIAGVPNRDKVHGKQGLLIDCLRLNDAQRAHKKLDAHSINLI